VEAAQDKASGAALHHLELVHVLLLMGVPHRAAVLEYRSHESFICCFFYFAVLNGEISFDE